MKPALAIGITLAYLAVLSIGPSDRPSVAEELAFAGFLAIAFSVAFLRFCGGPVWLPPLIVALGTFALIYPAETLVGHPVTLVGPFFFSAITSLGYRFRSLL